jgi:hypothetical protein
VQQGTDPVAEGGGIHQFEESQHISSLSTRVLIR